MGGDPITTYDTWEVSSSKWAAHLKLTAKCGLLYIYIYYGKIHWKSKGIFANATPVRKSDKTCAAQKSCGEIFPKPSGEQLL